MFITHNVHDSKKMIIHRKLLHNCIIAVASLLIYCIAPFVHLNKHALVPMFIHYLRNFTINLANQASNGLIIFFWNNIDQDLIPSQVTLNDF